MINNRHSNRSMFFIINYYETVSLNDSRCTFDDEIVGLSCVLFFCLFVVVVGVFFGGGVVNSSHLLVILMLASSVTRLRDNFVNVYFPKTSCSSW